MKTLEHLLAPIKIRNLTLPNRLVMPPMGTSLGNRDSTVSEANLAYMKRRAQSGVSLIITEITEVHPLGLSSPTCIGIWDDKFIPGLQKLSNVAHSQGSKIALQLHHTGRENYILLKKKQAIAPSAIPSYIFGFLGAPREMTSEEIEEAIAAFGAGARRAREAGFDAVELHGAHGYLLMQFLSAHSNRRTDEYGGDFKGRSRFMLDCLKEVRRQVGDDFPISIRVSGEECIKNGYTISDVQTIIPDLVTAGADMINVSFGTHGSPEVNIDTPNPSAPIEFDPGFKAHLARKVKEVTTVPVISVGRYTDPFFMDEVIARGDADMIAVGRQQLADPDFLKNAREGHPEDTLECLACNQGCIERLALEQMPIRCAINPQTGQELIYPEGPAAESKNVWVVGGGPGGLTAAFEAARLGHKVTLFEKEISTGGQLLFAEKAPHKSVYGRYVRTLAAKCIKQNVIIKTSTEVTGQMIEEGKPDAVILSVGAEKLPCPVENVTSSIVCDAWQILDGSVSPGNNVVVIGGGLVGMETADFLREKGVRNITVVEVLKKPPVLPISAHGFMLHTRLKSEGIKLLLGTKVKAIEESAVILEKDGSETRIEPVDQVIVAVGVTPRTILKAVLEEKGIRHFIIGDASMPRRIIEATTEGAQAAWDI
ncbi:MAG: NAD(P)/FAD-dependent oxidoreductase [Syntrophales bacterium]|jgi:2,4-dienoyl-CoA reductase-like NADH-dependent reductase (Old Yellow Enzyme family)/thioredoxin reductase|nr:NAD(P)/FAD-dependent oxidoreductase [Syntrophales bacterium]MDY0044388.1 FAD-dependent oxidoreductase [Syntrophales bacterium]